jgi:glycosyltransferase involved in cell wall biosynthesis
MKESAADMDGSGSINLVCFGGEDWWYHNRAHVDIQLARRFARMGRALYVNSIVLRKLNVTEGAMFFTRVKRKLASIRRGVVEAEPGFYVYSPLTFPVHHMPGARTANQAWLGFQMRRAMRGLGMREPIVWVACPAAYETAFRLGARAVAYQRADRMEEYPGVDAEEVRAMDRALKRRADVTFYVNHALYEQEAKDCRRAELIDHGVDFDRFARAGEDARIPEDMKGVKRPVVGFFGGIDDHTSDIPLAAEVARMCPAYTFVFVGSASADLGAFDGLGNVRFLGKKAYEEIPHYGKCFDVAIMPWRQNRWIELCNPIKLKEYLALGKPIVSTPFKELDYYKGHVYVARGAEEFAAALRKALEEDSEERRTARRERVRGVTWEAQAEKALGAIRDAIGGRLKD